MSPINDLVFDAALLLARMFLHLLSPKTQEEWHLTVDGEKMKVTVEIEPYESIFAGAEHQITWPN